MNAGHTLMTSALPIQGFIHNLEEASPKRITVKFEKMYAF